MHNALAGHVLPPNARAVMLQLVPAIPFVAGQCSWHQCRSPDSAAHKVYSSVSVMHHIGSFAKW